VLQGNLHEPRERAAAEAHVISTRRASDHTESQLPRMP
jgi:hypothetical protein